MKIRLSAWLNIAAQLALVFWAGATWAAGYVFVPVLFATYGREQAGEVAGRLLGATHLIGLASAMLMLLNYRVRFSKQLQQQSALWLLLTVLFLVLIQYVGFAPMMQKAKLAADAAQFGSLHGMSQIVYLLQSLGLAGLVYELLIKNK